MLISRQNRFYRKENVLRGILLFLSFFLSINFSWAKVKNITLFYIGSAPPGKIVQNGHTSACESIRNQILIEENRKQLAGEPTDELNIELKNINDFSIYPTQKLIEMEENYINLIKSDRKKYSRMYKSVKEARRNQDPLLVETFINLEQLSNYLEGVGPYKKKIDVVIGAHWLVPLAIIQLKTAGRAKDLKVGWVFTDYYDNPILPQMAKCLDGAFLGDQNLVYNFRKEYGNYPDNLSVTGIPINPYAKKPINKNNFLSKKGLKTDPSFKTIILAGGGEGLGNFPVIVEMIRKQFLNTPKKIQIVVITAKNTAHFDTLTKQIANWKEDKNFVVKLERMVPNEELLDYIKSADLYIVKSGGLSPSEGAEIGTPMILLDVLGGHEAENARFYSSINIGIVNKDPTKIGDIVESLLFDIQLINKMKEAQKKFTNQHNFNKVAEFIFDPTPPLNRTCWEENRTYEGKRLLREIDLGSRDENVFVTRSWPFLEKGIAGDKKALDLAEISLRNSIMINPHNSSAYFLLSHIEYAKGNYFKAIKYLEKSLEFDFTKGTEGQFFFKAISRFEQGEIEKGIDDLLQSLSISNPEPDPINFVKKHKALLMEALKKTLREKKLSETLMILNAYIKIENTEKGAGISNYMIPFDSTNLQNFFKNELEKKVQKDSKSNVTSKCPPTSRLPQKLEPREEANSIMVKVSDGSRRVFNRINGEFFLKKCRMGGFTLEEFILRQLSGNYPSDLTMKDPNLNRNALSWCVAKNRLEEVSGMLVYAKYDPYWVDINQVDGQGDTALMIAIKSNNEKMVKFLIEAGADIKIKNKNKTALDIAKETGKPVMVEILNNPIYRSGKSLANYFEELFNSINTDNLLKEDKDFKLCPLLEGLEKLK